MASNNMHFAEIFGSRPYETQDFAPLREISHAKAQSLFKELHRYRIPVNDLFLKITVIAGQRGCSCPETKGCILNHSLACSDRIKEVGEMIQVFVITHRRAENRYRLWWVASYLRQSILRCRLAVR